MLKRLLVLLLGNKLIKRKVPISGHLSSVATYSSYMNKVSISLITGSVCHHDSTSLCMNNKVIVTIDSHGSFS